MILSPFCVTCFLELIGSYGQHGLPYGMVYVC